MPQDRIIEEVTLQNVIIVGDFNPVGHDCIEIK